MLVSVPLSHSLNPRHWAVPPKAQAPAWPIHCHKLTGCSYDDNDGSNSVKLNATTCKDSPGREIDGSTETPPQKCPAPSLERWFRCRRAKWPSEAIEFRAFRSTHLWLLGHGTLMPRPGFVLRPCPFVPRT